MSFSIILSCVTFQCILHFTVNATEPSDVDMGGILPADGEDSENFNSLVDRLMKVASVEQVYKWKDECARKTPDGDPAFHCLKDILRMYEPGVVGYRPCVKSYTRYAANPMQLPYVQTVVMCDACVKLVPLCFFTSENLYNFLTTYSCSYLLRRL